MNQNFDPFIDWDSVTQEMADDMHVKILEYKEAIKKFEAENTISNCADVLRLQFELTTTSNSIHAALFTVPVMVHNAGEKVSDSDSEGHSVITQRCTRCGSVLQGWREGMAVLTPNGIEDLVEDKISWWKPGDVVAKASDAESMTMYVIEDRDLDKHERECVDISHLEGSG
jgi:hypothetical protein